MTSLVTASSGVKADYSGLKRLRARLKALEKKEIEWGFLYGTHSQADMSYAALAFLLEYGRRNEAGTGWDIPPRPAFRQSVQELTLNDDYRDHVAKKLRRYLISDKGVSPTPFLQASGQFLKSSYQESMTDWRFNGSQYKHNAKMTIELKGKDQPYVDTGELVQNVAYRTKDV